MPNVLEKSRSAFSFQIVRGRSIQASKNHGSIRTMSSDQTTAPPSKEDGTSVKDPILDNLTHIRTRVERISIKVTAMRNTLYFIAFVITLIGVLHLILA